MIDPQKLIALADAPRMTVHGRLFQAAMWRAYAMAWNHHCWSCVLGLHVGRSWCEKVLRVSREECIRRARVNIYLARRLNRNARRRCVGVDSLPHSHPCKPAGGSEG